MLDLPAFRSCYSAFLRPERTLLTGHSHQAWPDAARDAQARYFDESAAWVDDKWGQAVFPRIERVARRILQRMDFPDTDPLAFGRSTHELVFRLMSCLRWSERPRIVTTRSEFHSLYRQLLRLSEEGVEVVWIDGWPRATLAERLREAIDDRTAMVALSGVFFEDAAILPGLGAVLEHAVHRGAITLVDLYHGFNVTPVDLGPAASQVFVTSGGYKYAQFGEGICWLRVPPGCALRPAYTGWFADFAALDQERSWGPVAYGAGAERFAGATFDPSSFYRAEAALEHFDRFGLDVATLRQISQRQTARLIEGLEGEAELVTPRDAEARGGFVSLRVPRAEEVVRKLRTVGVFVDARNDLLRLGPAPYLTDEELDRGIALTRDALRALR
ncbi:MAG: aminotransferase class V-fold PLP-dependent enzyme [Polyangiaceae bacterium]|jgi:selenocysteine lyase/cysteine desulfurase|nr:aminotransferase class V-fold PLP-dependent enzyme [Polyangiaceae bacterium]